MCKAIHVVFGDASMAMINNYLRSFELESECTVIRFRESFAEGSIYRLDTDEGVEKRYKWLKHLECNSLSVHIELFEPKNIIDIHKEIRDISCDSKVIVWHGNNCSDQIGLRYLCSVLCTDKLFEINFKKAFENHMMEGDWCSLSLAFCDINEVKKLHNTNTLMSKERRNQLTKEWKLLRKRTDKLRVLRDGEIFCVAEDYFDELIIENCTYDYQNAGNVIGIAMMESGQHIGDIFFRYRMKYLIENDIIDYKGDLRDMLMLEVKKKEIV